MLLDPEEMNRRLSRHFDFWQEKYVGEGAYIAVRALDETVLRQYPEVQAPATIKEKWFNIEYRLKKSRHKLNTTYYAGDAVPTVYVDLGAGVMPALFGVEYRLAEETVWFDENPVIADWGNIPELKIHYDSEMYKTIMDLTQRLCEDSAGRYLVSTVDIGANLDVLAALRDREKLLRDIVREPEKVKTMVNKIDDFWMDLFDENTNLINRYLTGIPSYTPIVNKKKWYKLMSEFSVMISPAVFQDIVLPALQREADHLEQAVFNLDGNDQIKHLPMILALRGLHSIEWNPVPSYALSHNSVSKNFISKESFKVYHEIQQAGKKLIINGIRPEQVEQVLTNISPDGVFLFVTCPSRKIADDFLGYSQKWRQK